MFEINIDIWSFALNGDAFEPALPKWCTSVPSYKNFFLHLHLISVVFIPSIKPHFLHLIWMMIMPKGVLNALM